MPLSRNRIPDEERPPQEIEVIPRRSEQPSALVEQEVRPRLRKRRRRDPPPRRLGYMGTLRLAGILSLATIVLVFACLALIMMVGVVDFLSDPINNFLGVFGFEEGATPQVVDSRTIVLKIQDLAVLETVSGNIEITQRVVDTSASPDAELLVSYIGTVRVGIDLSLITEEDVIVNPDNSLAVTLPPPQITACALGKPDILSWDCTGWGGLQDCNERRNRAQDEAYDRAMEELLETAYELDLPGLADQNAKAALYDLLSALGYENVEFKQSDMELPVDESCFP